MRASSERSSDGNETVEVLEDERQLWDLMRPDPTESRRRKRGEQLAELLKRLLTDYPQLLVVPLAVVAPWVLRLP
jgi:hypothetical protein